ncbi:flagella basal body P-ring formation protein FlgA [Halanaerobium saccharolyticum]|jgi:flagella basal body P-ring formation protein FlgA|uniref:Flagella basal body P-ring formation protein FlgA n=1 Tax=Halanaerobium saccharolyticum TaxID=43595 RepID=A0A2T5RGF3_9FIRM|nr:flagellar basal body P-ring formation chaperone FlgA [Halanaerobium saccharolyticum]OEG61920.1 MAG: flagella basal body P-ring formation protein FlgA [Halanaerobium sp. MDAL1]PTV93800.1 flagella basal body P-ring formation protein FlgA [Halanaerobium saccharolyticum]TDP89229.1 flagella basal body P-ring formation protein FlgA [Halanaerobium saccharolyticum]
MKKIIIILTVLISISITFNAAAFEIEIKKEAEVNSAEIYLGEIAEIKAGGLSESALTELENLVLKSSPNPGYQKRLTRVLVDLSIQNLGYKKSQFNLKMPATVVVSRRSIEISEAEISALVEDYLKTKLDFAAEKIIIKSRNSAPELKIAAGDYQLKVAENQNLSLPDINLKLEVWQDGKKLRRLFYPVQVELLLEVLTAAKDLKSGAKIKKSDFTVQEKSISGAPEKIVQDWSEINASNVLLARNLNKGEILKSNNLKIPYVVKWGQKLNLKVNVNNINLSTFVEAKERGKIGEIITVENLNSGYQFQVEVVSPTEVKMISD